MSYDYGDTIAKALASEGGHLFIGRGGFSLHYENGWLSGYDCEPVKAAAIAVGLPVIDSRKVDFGKVTELAICGPIIAVAESYARAGADVYNLPLCGTRAAAA